MCARGEPSMYVGYDVVFVVYNVVIDVVIVAICCVCVHGNHGDLLV